ncbi:DUF2461 domain-containing protein [Saccharicrinis sp. FJH62]|uniref:DUF2461 domain-containing protein n=1 Tax=Saccharicrinis sp. FJH62 TaxID=3344657 RepID=UPI0035D4FEFF
MKQILEFLSDLKQNNNREWFNGNRKRYDEAKKTFIAFTELLINELRTIDPEIPLLDPKSCVFRIFRDVRFSADKSPYKTNFGTYMSPGGRKSIYAGYYFHMEPDNCFIGGGCYMPQAPELKAIREAIYQSPEDYLDITNNKAFKDMFGEVWGDELKTAPKGFDKEWEHIDLIRKKSYVGMRQLDPAILESPDLLDECRKTYTTLYPLNRFLNDVLKS